MRTIVQQYRGKASQKDLCEWMGLARSSRYYQPSTQKRGVKPSTHTLKQDGKRVSNTEVIETLLHEVYSQEFNRYGYRLSTAELQEMGFVINHKKVYRLMRDHGLLLDRINKGKIQRKWVKWRVIKDAKPMEHLCMDIKYVYIQGAKRNAYLLVIMDIATRFVLGWTLRFSMKHTDVILCLHGALRGYFIKGIILRTDNGSQFIALGLQKYCQLQHITQEFTHVATPEENAYVESLFSCVEREVIQAYEFDSLYHAKEVFTRYFHYHNTSRRRHALGRKSPLQYWNTVFHCHAVKPPTALSAEVVKGDEAIENKHLSSLALPLTTSERGLSLLKQDDNDVLNHL